MKQPALGVGVVQHLPLETVERHPAASLEVRDIDLQAGDALGLDDLQLLQRHGMGDHHLDHQGEVIMGRAGPARHGTSGTMRPITSSSRTSTMRRNPN